MLMGQMESLAPLLPLGNLHKRPFQCSFRTHWNQATEGWDKLVPTSSWLRLSLEQWLNEAWLLQGVPISRQEPQEELHTDASCRGLGAHCGDPAVSGTWSSTQAAWHINRLEMQAVLEAILSLGKFLTGMSVLLCTDNTTVACYLNKGGGGQDLRVCLAWQKTSF